MPLYSFQQVKFSHGGVDFTVNHGAYRQDGREGGPGVMSARADGPFITPIQLITNNRELIIERMPNYVFDTATTPPFNAAPQIRVAPFNTYEGGISAINLRSDGIILRTLTLTGSTLTFTSQEGIHPSSRIEIQIVGSGNQPLIKFPIGTAAKILTSAELTAWNAANEVDIRVITTKSSTNQDTATPVESSLPSNPLSSSMSYVDADTTFASIGIWAIAGTTGGTHFAEYLGNGRFQVSKTAQGGGIAANTFIDPRQHRMTLTRAGLPTLTTTGILTVIEDDPDETFYIVSVGDAESFGSDPIRSHTGQGVFTLARETASTLRTPVISLDNIIESVTITRLSLDTSTRVLTVTATGLTNNNNLAVAWPGGSASFSNGSLTHTLTVAQVRSLQFFRQISIIVNKAANNWAPLTTTPWSATTSFNSGNYVTDGTPSRYYRARTNILFPPNENDLRATAARAEFAFEQQARWGHTGSIRGARFRGNIPAFEVMKNVFQGSLPATPEPNQSTLLTGIWSIQRRDNTDAPEARIFGNNLRVREPALANDSPTAINSLGVELASGTVYRGGCATVGRTGGELLYLCPSTGNALHAHNLAGARQATSLDVTIASNLRDCKIVGSELWVLAGNRTVYRRNPATLAAIGDFNIPGTATYVGMTVTDDRVWFIPQDGFIGAGNITTYRMEAYDHNRAAQTTENIDIQLPSGQPTGNNHFRAGIGNSTYMYFLLRSNALMLAYNRSDRAINSSENISYGINFPVENCVTQANRFDFMDLRNVTPHRNGLQPYNYQTPQPYVYLTLGSDDIMRDIWGYGDTDIASGKTLWLGKQGTTLGSKRWIWLPKGEIRQGDEVLTANTDTDTYSLVAADFDIPLEVSGSEYRSPTSFQTISVSNAQISALSLNTTTHLLTVTATGVTNNQFLRFTDTSGNEYDMGAGQTALLLTEAQSTAFQATSVVSVSLITYSDPGDVELDMDANITWGNTQGPSATLGDVVSVSGNLIAAGFVGYTGSEGNITPSVFRVTGGSNVAQPYGSAAFMGVADGTLMRITYTNTTPNPPTYDIVGTTTRTFGTHTHTAGSQFNVAYEQYEGYKIRVGSVTEMQTAFGVNNINYGDGNRFTFRWNPSGTFSRTFTAAVRNGVRLTGLSINVNTRVATVTSTGLQATQRYTVTAGSTTVEFAANTATHTLTTAQLSAVFNNSSSIGLNVQAV